LGNELGNTWGCHGDAFFCAEQQPDYRGQHRHLMHSSSAILQLMLGSAGRRTLNLESGFAWE
jgi:hypothetical protein